MDSDERFIKLIKKQFFPYKPEQDIESETGKWDVTEGECIASWLRTTLMKCRKRSQCARRESCEFFDYPDLAKRNYKICNEMIIRLENGVISCLLERESGE